MLLRMIYSLQSYICKNGQWTAQEYIDNFIDIDEMQRALYLGMGD